MLAAASNRSSALALFEVVLRAVEDNTAQISDPLRIHTVDVLKQAVSVVTDPRTITASTPKEAIELALHLRDNTELFGKLAAAMQGLNVIPPDLAKGILDSLQPLAA